MYRILRFENGQVLIGTDDNMIVRYPSGCLNYPDAQIGDIVEIYGEGNDVVITKSGRWQNANSYKQPAQPLPANVKRVNKHLFVWVFSFLFGGFGIDRFVRGQIGTGIAKLLFNWVTFGIWELVDWIIALVKAYGSAYSGTDQLTFVDGKYDR